MIFVSPLVPHFVLSFQTNYKYKTAIQLWRCCSQGLLCPSRGSRVQEALISNPYKGRVLLICIQDC